MLSCFHVCGPFTASGPFPVTALQGDPAPRCLWGLRLWPPADPGGPLPQRSARPSFHPDSPPCSAWLPPVRSLLTSSRTFPDHLLVVPQLPQALLGAGVTGLLAFWGQDTGAWEGGCWGLWSGCQATPSCLEPEELDEAGRTLPGACGGSTAPRHLGSSIGSGTERGHVWHPEPPSAWRCVAVPGD